MAIDVSICVPLPHPKPPGLLSTSTVPLPAAFPLARRRPLLTESIRASLHLSSHHISPSPPLPHPPRLPLHGSLSTTAIVSADVRRGARGGGGGEGVEPQSGNRSEAAQLHLAADLAARDQPHELPAHGKHPASTAAPKKHHPIHLCIGPLTISVALWR